MGEDDTYPSVRDALFDDDKVANLYCGIKWLIWQVGYLIFGTLLVVIGVPVVIAIVAVFLVVEGMKLLGSRLADVINPYLESSVGKTAPKARQVGKAAKSAPITRRIYNECPVDITMRPRWWDAIKSKLDEF